MEANELYAEIEKRLVEISQLIRDNKEAMKPEHKFGFFFNYMLFNEQDNKYHTINEVAGQSSTVVASAAMQMTDDTTFAKLMMNAVHCALKTAIEKPEFAEEIIKAKRFNE